MPKPYYGRIRYVTSDSGRYMAAADKYDIAAELCASGCDVAGQIAFELAKMNALRVIDNMWGDSLWAACVIQISRLEKTNL